MLIAFLENHLQADGTVTIPEVLQPLHGRQGRAGAQQEVILKQALIPALHPQCGIFFGIFEKNREKLLDIGDECRL